MKKLLIIFPAAALAALLFSGCASKQARYIDPEGRDTIVSLNKVDIQDFKNAAESLTEDMFDTVPDLFAGRPTLALSTVTNDTTTNFDVSLITNKIQGILLRSGNVKVSRAMSADAERDVVREKAKAAGAASTEIPKLSLTGIIHEIATDAGKTKQISYVFQMQLADVSTGDLLWVGEKTITKQGKKNAVGW